jgi:hypothetical protein
MGKGSFKYFAAAILLFSLLSSCNKTVVNNTVFTDSYIHSVFNTTDTVESKRYPIYSVMHTAYCYTKLASVRVNGSSGSVVNLTDYDGTGFSFYTPIKDSAAYKINVPAPETYTYNVSYVSGETVVQTDATLAESLMPARNLNAVRTTTTTADNILVSWKPVTNAEAYKIRIQSEDPTSKVLTLIYESDFMVPLDPTATLSVSFPFGNFQTYLNTNIYFEISAFIFQQNHETYHAVSETTIKRYYGI